jgi:hypothetical protein
MKTRQTLVNVWIGKSFQLTDLSLLLGSNTRGFGEFNLYYEEIPSRGMEKILIDCGIAESWGALKGTNWKDFKIEKGFSDIFLDNLKLRDVGYEEKNRKNWSGFRPSRISILNNCDVD